MISKRVVITGGGGFVGRHLVAELLRAWPDVTIEVWDQKVDNLPQGVAGVVVDITKPEGYIARLQELQPDWVVHLAAVASVAFAIQHPDITEQVNVEGTRHLLSAIVRHSSATKVLAVSSADIYPPSVYPTAELPLSAAQPANPYAASKLEMEKVIEEQFNEHCIRVRPFPHIGPGQAVGFVTADFASQIAAAETSETSHTMKVGNLNARRDFTDVRDVVRAYRLLMEKGKLREVYNVASGKAWPIEEILQKLLALSTVEISVEQDPARSRPADNPVLVGDATKLMTATGWKPQIPLDQSLRDILDYWRSVRTSYT